MRTVYVTGVCILYKGCVFMKCLHGVRALRDGPETCHPETCHPETCHPETWWWLTPGERDWISREMGDERGHMDRNTGH